MAPPVAADPQIAAAIKQLDTLAANAPDLAGPIAYCRAVLPLLRQAQAEIEPFSLDPGSASAKLDAGLPLLVGEELPLDAESTRALFLRLCRAAETLDSAAHGRLGRLAESFAALGRPRDGQGGPQRAAARIRRLVESTAEAGAHPMLDLQNVWAALAGGDWQPVELMAQELQLDAGLLRLLAQNSLKPALHVWAQALDGVVDLDGWRRGTCPICGSPPTLSEIRGKEGERRLRCGMCGAGWYYPRLQCAFCANQDYRQLGYISAEGQAEKYRLQTCDLCRGYLKTVVTFDPIPADLLAVEDLATLHLDQMAAERSYARVPVRLA